MSSENSRAITALNDLVAVCQDGARGYDAAAHHVEQGDLKELFARFSLQRVQFADALQAEARRLGDEAHRHGTLAGRLHRGWMRVETAIAGADAHAALNECARGEEAALKHYEAALRGPLPDDLRAVLERQYGRVKEAYARVCGLRYLACHA